MVGKNSSSLNACTLLNNSNTVTATRFLGVEWLFLHYITPVYMYVFQDTRIGYNYGFSWLHGSFA